MNDKRPDSIVVENSIENIGKQNWNNCANHEASSYNPFVSYEFLNALEKSNSVIPHIVEKENNYDEMCWHQGIFGNSLC